jgi:hypothetical protein
MLKELPGQRPTCRRTDCADEQVELSVTEPSRSRSGRIILLDLRL